MLDVLFVDDESRVLDGIRRMLLPERARWRPHFVTSGREAIAHLESCKVDVLVTDMRMPEMDGAALLSQVSERWPSTIRIVLSGHSDSESALRAMTAAHQFLSKPCDRSTLVAVIERALALRPVMDDDRVREVLHRIGTLPPTPRIYARIVALLNDTNRSIDDLQVVIGQDPGLAGKVMHLANSSFFGRSGSMTSLSAAVSLLGTTMLRNLVLTAEVLRDLGNVPADIGLSVEALQERSLAVARIAAGLEPRAPWREEAYLAGLLHDMGLLVLATRLPDDYRAVTAACRGCNDPRAAVERRVLGMHHGDLGAYLFRLWGLPEIIVEAVSAHEDLVLSPDEPLNPVRAVAVADVLVDAVRAEDAAILPPSRFASDPRWPDWLARSHSLLETEAA